MACRRSCHFRSLGGTNSAAGRIVKEIAFRVSTSAGFPSPPVLRVVGSKLAVNFMGSSFHLDKDAKTSLTFVQAIACLPEANTTSLRVGVAEEAKVAVGFFH